MATIDISFNKLKEELNNPTITVDELEEILFNFGLEIDGYNEENDTLKVEITAERVDLLSFDGLVRALKAYMGVSKYTAPEIKESGFTVNVGHSTQEYGNYTMCAIIKNLSLDDNKIKEIINVQEKLHITYGRKRKAVAIGVYPLDKIKFPISFEAKAPEEIKFIPLGETKEMNGKEIIEEHPTGKEYSKLVEGKTKYLVFTDNNNQILSMPPIINSANTGKITEETKDLFIECTGNNLSKLKYVIAILIDMFKDFGGDIYSLNINYPDKTLISPDTKEDKAKVSLKEMNMLLGTDIQTEQACELFEKMMYTCKPVDEDNIELIIPKFRTDVLHDNDIADDLGRAFGFNNILPKNGRVVSTAEKDEISINQENIINTMVAMGFQEVMPLTLSSEKDSFDNFLINKEQEKYMKLGFSAESSLNIVGNWLMPKLLKTLANNQHRSFPQKIFACDYIVKANDTKDVRSETILHTSCMIANSKISFTEISSILLGLCNVLGKKLELRKQDYSYYMQGRSATVVIDNKVVGSIGELHPKVLLNNSYTNPVCAFEIEI